MKNVHILALSVLLATVTIGGCTSKPVIKQPTSTITLAANEANGADGASTAGLGSNTSGFNTTGLGANAGANTGLNSGANSGTSSGVGSQDPVRQALLARVVHFELDSSDIAQSDFALLNAHAQYLSQNAAARAVLTGHTDERGTREYNMALGERRAKSVQTYLVTNGTRADQIDVVSYGKEKPVNEGHDEAAWAENRRVEISYDKLDPNK
jgi:peptidoglycan-associated lipoprotein